MTFANETEDIVDDGVLPVDSRFNRRRRRRAGQHAPDYAAVIGGDSRGELSNVAGGVRPPRPGRRVGHLDLGADHHDPMPGMEN